jgi:hypothetical protein
MTTRPLARDVEVMQAAHRAAGYCIAGRALGLVVREVLVHDDLGKRMKGLCWFRPRAAGDDRLVRAASLATVAYAGPLAEVRFRAIIGETSISNAYLARVTATNNVGATVLSAPFAVVRR